MRVRVGNMAGFGLCTLVILLFSIEIAHFTDPAAVCVIELECAECVPDNAPLVTSHVAATGAVSLAAGEEVTLSCAGGRFLAYPLRATLRARCEDGRYRVAHDRSLRHLLDLGCQENVFEDVLHEVEDCSPPLQGRVYLVREGAGEGGARHLAAACFDADRGEAVRVRMSGAPHNRLPLAPHRDHAAPLSVLGNFNHMFDATTRRDAARLYSDDARLNRRLREAFKHDRFAFADQTLTSATLLSPRYFEDRNARVTDFASNRVAVWSGVAKGNLDHLQRDVAEFLKKHRARVALDVHAGAHGVLALRTGAGAGVARREVYLRAGGRFPVPRYLWTAVHARGRRAALVLFVLNDPFVAVSEIREAVFCESVCGRVPWLRELVRQRRYETAVYGLVFCCRVEDALPHVPGLPRALRDLAPGDEGLLTDLLSDETSARE